MAVAKQSDIKVDSSLVLNSQVAAALAVIGDRWAILIVRDVYLGVRQFEELRKNTGAARGTLSSRLLKLVQNGILYKNPYQNTPVRYEYRLTDKGLALYPLVLAAWSWEMKWGDGEHLPPELMHKLCGKSMRPRYRCGHCNQEIEVRAVTVKAGPNPGPAKKIPPRSQRRSRARGNTHPDVDRRFFHVSDVLGDRWTALTVTAAFLGVRRFDDFGTAIGIATNILSDRLKTLLNVGVFRRQPYQQNPVRYEYRLSDKGKDLYPTIVAMHEWANRWLVKDRDKPLRLNHSICSRRLAPTMVCSACDAPLKPGEVAFES